MYSGKTSKLLELYKQFLLCKVPTVVVNHHEDIRYTDKPKLSTHDQITIPCVIAAEMNEISLDTGEESCQVYLINEGQFFPDIVEWVKKAVSRPYNKKVYVCGLDGDFERNTFGNWLSLITYSDSVTKLKSLCYDCKQNDALFSYRLTWHKEQKMIGSSSYIPLCRFCYEERI
jgi:thymidine kinase